MAVTATVQSGVCTVCHRPLRDPESVQAGKGPVCRGKTKMVERGEEGERTPPQHTLEEITPEDLPKGLSRKIYSGVRYGSTVQVDVVGGRGGSPYSRRPLRHIVYHSPDGFEWGYGGSGPADLARSILADVAGLRVADALYQEFKSEVIAGLERESFALAEAEIRDWLNYKIR